MKSSLKAKIGIFSMSLLSMAPLGIVPSIALIAASFPEASVSEVQMLTSIPSLMSLVAAVIVARIANVIPRKILAVTGPALVFIGGILPFLLPANLPLMLVCSGVLGCGVGFVSNLTQVLITDLLSPEERQEAMAMNTVFVNVGGIFMMFVGGQLAAGGWKNNYLVYLIALIVVIAVIAMIPMKSERVEEAKEAGPKPKMSESITANVIAIAAIAFVYMLLYNVFANNIALLLSERNLGDSGISGIVSSIGLIGGMLAGMVIGKIIPYFQKVSLGVSFALLALAMAVIALVPDATVITVAAFFTGVSMTILMAQAPFLISLSTTSLTMPGAMAVYSIGSSFGSFASPTVMNLLNDAVFGGGAGNCILLAAIACVVAAVVVIASGFQVKVLEQLKR
ncbi:MAG: MFS transporter [Coriobacteriia bacterium]|nr:MFS transporter [Coriobacteriia bacterium]